MLAFPAEFVGLRVVDDDALAAAIDQAHDVLRGGVRAHLFHQADALDGAQRLVIQAHASWIVDQGVACFEHGHRMAIAAKDIGEHEAGWAGAHNQDFAGGGCGISH